MICNANPRNKETKKPKNNGHKEYSNEAQGPCQNDSIRLSLLYPKLFKCTSSIRVLIHMRMITNSKIGIKVQSLYQFTNEYHRILCLRHRYFWFVCSLSSLQLVTVWTNLSRLSTKVTNRNKFRNINIPNSTSSLRFWFLPQHRTIWSNMTNNTTKVTGRHKNRFIMLSNNRFKLRFRNFSVNIKTFTFV